MQGLRPVPGSLCFPGMLFLCGTVTSIPWCIKKVKVSLAKKTLTATAYTTTIRWEGREKMEGYFDIACVHSSKKMRGSVVGRVGTQRDTKQQRRGPAGTTHKQIACLLTTCLR